MAKLTQLRAIRHVQIVEYEKGRKTPSAETLIALAQVMECSLDWLCGLSDQPRPCNHGPGDEP